MRTVDPYIIFVLSILEDISLFEWVWHWAKPIVRSSITKGEARTGFGILTWLIINKLKWYKANNQHASISFV